MKKVVVSKVVEEKDDVRIMFENYDVEIVIDKDVFNNVFNKDVKNVVLEMNEVWKKCEGYKSLRYKIGCKEFVVKKDKEKGFVVSYEVVSYRECYSVDLEFDY